MDVLPSSLIGISKCNEHKLAVRPIFPNKWVIQEQLTLHMANKRA